MKKLLLILFLSLPLLGISQDIQKIFFGNELGVSKKNEVIANLNKKNIKNEKIINDNHLQAYDVSFGGRLFSSCLFSFTNNDIFYTIGFLSKYEDKEVALLFYNNLKYDLGKKYNLVKGIGEYNYNSFNSNNLNVSIDLNFNKNLYAWVVTLIYIDIKIMNEISEEGKNEL